MDRQTKALSLCLAVVLCAAAAGDVQTVDRDVRIGGETFRFEARPELGFLLKSDADVSAVEVIEPAQADPPPQRVRRVRGRGRRNLAVVHAFRSRPENEENMARLRADSRVRYVAPLYAAGAETLAVLPEVIVRTGDGVEAEDLQEYCEALGLSVSGPLELTSREYLVEVPAAEPNAVFAAVEALGQAAFLEWVVPNTAFRPVQRGSVVPDDTYFANQWHLDNTGQSGGLPGADINAPEAWEITTGDSRIVVAVLDNGVDLDHPDLQGNLVPGYDFYEDDYVPDAGGADPCEAHGTACAGLIAARGNNGLGVRGVAWKARIMPVRISGAGDDYIAESEIATAIRWAAANGADVLSNSWGWELATDAIHSAVVDVTRLGGLGRDGKGCVVLWAAGNSGSDIPSRDPAAFTEAIAVGATDHADDLWDYSARGSELDVVAPSGEGDSWGATEDLWTTDVLDVNGYSLNNNRAYLGLDYTDQMGGTSGACPIAAGVAALILSVNPMLNGRQAKQVLQRSAVDLGVPGRDDQYGHGRVDARAAVELALTSRVDVNLDGRVDFRDFAMMGRSWSGDDPQTDIIPIERRDGKVDTHDLEALGQFWLTRFGRPSPPLETN